jgi:glycosyltransferase involved in cell wall biosynthesis
MRTLTALPIYNEERHLVDVLGRVRQFADDVLVVDDGSSDRTPDLLASIEGIDVIRHLDNSGYGAALQTAFNHAIAHDYDVLVTIDCDGQHEPQLIPRLAAAVFPPNEQPWDIVSGSRYLSSNPGDSAAPEERRKINETITAQMNACFGLKLTDAFCGFKAYRVEALKKFEITELGYAMPLQLWVQAVRHGMRILEYPVPLIYLDEKRSFGGTLDDGARRLAYYREIIRKEMELQHVECGAT